MRLLFLFVVLLMCPGAQAMDVVSPLVSSENPIYYNGWTEFDRATPIDTSNGRIIALGMYSTVPCQWRPKIGKRLDAHDLGQPKWLVTYNHHQIVAHPGNGWHWVELTIPVQPFDGVYFAGAYVTGCPSSPGMQMSVHRAEMEGDINGIVTLSENQYQTFAMGVRYFGEPSTSATYRYDFSRGDLDGWGGYAATVGEVSGSFSSTSPFTEDFNHDDLIGTFTLLAYRYWESGVPGGGWSAPNWNGARIRARVKFNLTAPQGTNYYLHFQGRIPGTTPSQFANWTYTGFPLNQYADGNWHDIDVTLPSDPAQYTFAGGPPPLYTYAPLDVALGNLQDFIIIAARPPGSAIPTGTFRMDWVQIDYQE